MKSSGYSENVNEAGATVSIENINTATDYWLFINGVQHQYTNHILKATFEYNKDYIMELKPKNAGMRRWSYISSTIGCNMTITKANQLEVPITQTVSDVRYIIREYIPAELRLDPQYFDQGTITWLNTFNQKNVYGREMNNECIKEDSKPYYSDKNFLFSESSGIYHIHTKFISVTNSNDATDIASASGDIPLLNKLFVTYNFLGNNNIYIFIYEYQLKTPSFPHNIVISDNWGHKYDISDINMEIKICDTIENW